MSATEDDSPERQAQRLKLEGHCTAIGRLIGEAVRKASGEAGRPLGYALMMFDFGDGGDFAWISNADRADMRKMLLEAADKLRDHTQ